MTKCMTIGLCLLLLAAGCKAKHVAAPLAGGGDLRANPSAAPQHIELADADVSIVFRDGPGAQALFFVMCNHGNPYLQIVESGQRIELPHLHGARQCDWALR